MGKPDFSLSVKKGKHKNQLHCGAFGFAWKQYSFKVQAERLLCWLWLEISNISITMKWPIYINGTWPCLQFQNKLEVGLYLAILCESL